MDSEDFGEQLPSCREFLQPVLMMQAAKNRSRYNSMILRNAMPL
jgi:hypothetical protein